MLKRCTAALLGAAIASAAGIRIEVVRGSGLNNRAGVRTQAPVVRVLNDDAKPIPGALVIFTAPSTGASVDFGNGATAQASTDASGIAAAPPPLPVGGDGPVSIAVLAEEDGSVANAVISQMNLGFFPFSLKDDLEITLLPDTSAARAPKGKKVLKVRITDAAGATVAGVSVSLTIYQEKNTSPELVTVSGSDGTAEFTFDAKRIIKGLSLLSVRATANGVATTRMVRVD